MNNWFQASWDRVRGAKKYYFLCTISKGAFPVSHSQVFCGTILEFMRGVEKVTVL